MKRRAVTLLAVLSGLLLAFFLGYILTGLGKDRLRWKFVKGRVLRYEVSSTWFPRDGDGHPFTVSEIMSVTVDDVDFGGTATLSTKTGAFRIKSTDVDYDSRRDRELPPAYAKYAPDSSATFKMDSRGRLTEMARLSLKNWFDAALSPGEKGPAGKDVLWFLELPWGRVGVGDRWSVEHVHSPAIPIDEKERLVQAVRERGGGNVRIVLAEREAGSAATGGEDPGYIRDSTGSRERWKGTWVFSADGGFLSSMDWEEISGTPSSRIRRFRYELRLMGVSQDR